MRQGTIGKYFKKRDHPTDLESNNSESETVSGAKQTKDSPLSTVNSADTCHVDPAASEGAKTTNKCPGKRNFVDDWLRLFDWLQYDAETNSASCKVCQQKPNSRVDEKWVGGFSPVHNNFKKETFARHDKSKIHADNVRALQATSMPHQTPMAKCVKKMDSQMFSHMKYIFNIAYYIAKKEKPFTDFPDLLRLATKLDVPIVKKYSSDKQCRQFIHYIAKTITEELLEKLKQSQFISILIDGSTDRTTEEHAAVYVRYIDNGSVKEAFLGVVDLPTATSEGYYTALMKLLSDKLGEELLRKKDYIAGLGTDGAATMVGHRSGLSVKIKQIYPNLISVHCLAHRLQLALLDACKQSEYLNNLEEVLRSMFRYYSNSPKRLNNLKRTAQVLGEEIMKLGDMYQVRWVASKHNAIIALVKSWKAIVIDLQQAIANNTSDSAKAKGMLTSLSQFQFLKTLHFLLDFFGKIKPLSEAFQSRDLSIPAVKFKVEHTLKMIKALEAGAGHKEQEFLDNVSISGIFNEIQLQNVQSGERQFQNLRKKLLKEGQQYLTERLESYSSEITSSIHILDSMTWPDKANILNYGNNEITKIYEYLHPDTHGEIIDVMLAEWVEYKLSFSSVTFNEALKKASDHCVSRFENLMPVLTWSAVLPASTAACERGFSFFNRIKTAYRNSLTTTTMDDLLTISVNGPSLEDFQPDKALDLWYFSAERERYTNVQ